MASFDVHRELAACEAAAVVKKQEIDDKKGDAVAAAARRDHEIDQKQRKIGQKQGEIDREQDEINRQKGEAAEAAALFQRENDQAQREVDDNTHRTLELKEYVQEQIRFTADKANADGVKQRIGELNAQVDKLNAQVDKLDAQYHAMVTDLESQEAALSKKAARFSQTTVPTPVQPLVARSKGEDTFEQQDARKPAAVANKGSEAVVGDNTTNPHGPASVGSTDEVVVLNAGVAVDGISVSSRGLSGLEKVKAKFTHVVEVDDHLYAICCKQCGANARPDPNSAGDLEFFKSLKGLRLHIVRSHEAGLAKDFPGVFAASVTSDQLASGNWIRWIGINRAEFELMRNGQLPATIALNLGDEVSNPGNVSETGTNRKRSVTQVDGAAEDGVEEDGVGLSSAGGGHGT